MAAGRIFKLYVGDGGNPETFYSFAGLREKSQSHSAESVDNSGAEKDGFQRMLPDGRRSVSISGSGVTKGGEALRRIRNAIGRADLIRLKAEISGETVIGSFHVSSFEQNGSYQDAILFSASFQSAGPYEWFVLGAPLNTYDGNTIEPLALSDGLTADTMEYHEAYNDG